MRRKFNYSDPLLYVDVTDVEPIVRVPIFKMAAVVVFRFLLFALYIGSSYLVDGGPGAVGAAVVMLILVSTNFLWSWSYIGLSAFITINLINTYTKFYFTNWEQILLVVIMIAAFEFYRTWKGHRFT